MVVQMGVYLRKGTSELVNIKKTTDQGKLVHYNRMREKRERENKERKRRDVYRRTEEHVYVEHIEPHIGHLREEQEQKKVSGNYVTSVDANTFTL